MAKTSMKNQDDPMLALADISHAMLTQLRIANRLTAVSLKNSIGQQELVRILASTGAGYQEIADVLDTTTATVNTTLARLRKKAEKPLTSAESTNQETRGADE